MSRQQSSGPPGSGGDQEGGLTYAKAGVDIVKKAAAIERMRTLTQSTFRPGVLSDLGAFGGLFRLDLKRYPDPVLVSSADGVGTKLKLAFRTGIHDTVGIDLVAMNVDDLVVQGAEPLFFLDYIGIGQVDAGVLEGIVRGVAEGCRRAGCALIGGETAELPEFYAPGEYDLAGFGLGIVNGDQVLDGHLVEEGDAVIGLESSGLHSNGYSLARRALLKEDGGVFDLQDRPEALDGRTIAEELMEPTRIYAPMLLQLRERVALNAAAHITGGSFQKNVPRVLPAGLGADLIYDSWPHPPVFELIQQHGHVSNTEMERAFNLGLGMVLVVPWSERETTLAEAAELGLGAHWIGRIVRGAGVRILR